MHLQSIMESKMREWFGTDHTLPESLNKARVSKEAAMVANGVVRDHAGYLWKRKLAGIREAIAAREYGDYGVAIDEIREDLVEQFLRSIGCDEDLNEL